MPTQPVQPPGQLFHAAVLATLACPACQGELRLEAARMTCASCDRAYPIVDGIPVLIAERAGTAAGQNEPM